MNIESKRGVQYEEHFKREAVRLVRDEHLSIAQVARDLGVSQVSLSRWVRQAEEQSRPSVFAGVQEENRRLKRELELMTMEREISRKVPELHSQGFIVSEYTVLPRDFAADKLNVALLSESDKSPCVGGKEPMQQASRI